MNFADALREEARLIILQALRQQPDDTLSDALIGCALGTVGIRRSLDFVRAELAWLADVGAARVKNTADVTVATLTQRGIDHVERTSLIPGVKRPAPGT